jgi:hypothetical protein
MLKDIQSTERSVHRLLISIGGVITIFWFILGGYYIVEVVGWREFVVQPADAIGGFLEGGFAPLAFLWLVIGYFLQQQALQENTVVLAEQAKQSHRDSFIKMSELVLNQLGVIAGFLYISSQGPMGNQRHTATEMDEFWLQVTTGNTSLFVVMLINMRFSDDGTTVPVHDLYFGTEIRHRHSATFIDTFERLLRYAEEVDQEEMIQQSLLIGTAQGLLYRAMLEVRDNPDL